MQLKQVLRLVLGGGFGAAYLWLGYVVSISNDPPLLGLLVGLAPLTFSAIALAWHSRSLWLQALCAACVAAVIVYADFLRTNSSWVFFIQHAGMHAMLGIMFGRTLTGTPAQAFCSRIAALMQGCAADEGLFRYTWKVTLAWTCYFVAATVVSIGLFFFGPLPVWSAFANLLTPVLIGAIFVVEFLIRLWVLPPHQQISIARTISAYREYSQRTKPR